MDEYFYTCLFDTKARGDVENPRGGIRHLIVDKGYY
jgi:hypothetical protein